MFEDHAFLREVNKGPCRFLRGNVFVEMVFVEDQDNSWAKEEIDGFFPTYKSAMKGLCKQAHPAACAGAARCYRLGIGTVKNPAKAAAYENQERLFSRANPHDPYYKWLKA